MFNDFFKAVKGLLADQNCVVKTRRFFSVEYAGIGAFCREDCVPFLKLSEFIFFATSQAYDAVENIVFQLERVDSRKRFAR